MESFIHDIPALEFFLVLFMLLLGSVALQAYFHKRDLNHEELRILFGWLSKGMIGLSLLAAGLIALALLAK
jgi:hypothetical protein